MKLRSSFLLSGLICLQVLFLHAQEMDLHSESQFQHPCLITATSGLNLRAAPSMDAKVLAKISFLDEVLGVQDPRAQDGSGDGGSHTQLRPASPEAWTKVRYRGMVGWVFSPYLIKKKDPDGIKGGAVLALSEKPGYALLFEEQFQEYVSHAPDAYYYGYYRQGETFARRRIKVSYRVVSVDAEGVTLPCLMPETDQEDMTVFILSSPVELPEVGGINLQVLNSDALHRDGGAGLQAALASEAGRRLMYEPLGSDSLNGFPIDAQTKASLLLYSEGYNFMIAGDLDHDGRKDIIAQENLEKGVFRSTSVYLSSQASGADKVRMVFHRSWLGFHLDGEE